MSDITQKWVDVLIPFSSGYGRRLTASGISRETKIPQQTVSRVLNGLVGRNLIRYSREGKNKLFYFDLKNQSSLLILKMIECQRSLNFLGNKRVSLIIEDLLKEFDSFLIFGSYASGKQKSGSDLDVVIFSKKKSLSKIKSKYPIEINEHFLSFVEFRKLKDSPMIKEVFLNHVLFGDVDKIMRRLL